MFESENSSARVAATTSPLPTSARTKAAALWVTVAAYWYLTGLVVALAISFGYWLVAPGFNARRTGGDAVDALRTFDAEWYASIAAGGYSYDPSSRSSVAFFPLYPLLGRAVASVLPVRIDTALLIVSNVSFLGSLIVLAAYVRARYPGAPRDLADYVVLAAALFPTACFFRLAYSESTFLLVAILAMYAMLRGWPYWATVFVVGLGTAARPVGVALLAPLILRIWRLERPFARRVLALAVWVPLACWGLLGYMAYQQAAFDDPLAFAKTQRHWGVLASPTPGRRLLSCLALEPVATVYRPDSPAFWARRDEHRTFCVSLTFANPVYFLAAAALVAAGASRRADVLNRYEVSLAALLLLIPYITRGPEMGMASMGRFVAVAFPVHIVFGRCLVRLSPAAAAAILAASGVMMAAYAALFVGGYNIF